MSVSNDNCNLEVSTHTSSQFVLHTKYMFILVNYINCTTRPLHYSDSPSPLVWGFLILCYARRLFWIPITDKKIQCSCQWIILTHIRQICHALQAFLSRPSLPRPCITELSLNSPFQIGRSLLSVALKSKSSPEQF